ncbi:hypothetical protein DW966_01420 [Bacteroides stercoris]|nr:hypothetical protein DW966_01420 [Bacteroides stercoris]
MKTKISKWLIGLAEKLNPQERLSSIERVNNYEAKKLGIRLYRTKKEIKDYRKKMKLNEVGLIEKLMKCLLRKSKPKYANQS